MDIRTGPLRWGILALALITGAIALAGCGNDDGAESDATQARVLSGETETGMTLEAEPAIDPAEDPLLAELDSFRAAIGAPPVHYTRVIADNTDGEVADQGRALVVAPDAASYQMEGGIRLRFTCDALRYEWLPPEGDGELQRTHDDLNQRLCADGPPEPEGIEPGERQVYYLFTEQGLETRDLAAQAVFGPRGEELRP